VKIALSWTINESFLESAARAAHDAPIEDIFLDCLPVPRGIVTEARRRGHQVETLIGNSVIENSTRSRLSAPWMRRVRRTRPIPRIDVSLWQSWRDSRLLAWRPDVYIYCGAVPSPSAAARLKQGGALLVQYTGVYPARLSSRDPIRRGLSSADVAICNSEGIAQQASQLGCPHVHFVPSAYEDSHFRDLRLPEWEERPYDLGFVGEVGASHGTRRSFLVELFERCADLRLALFTNSQELPPALRKRARAAGGPRDLPALLAQSRISVNVQADGAERETRGLNFRTFEIPAARCVQLMLYQQGIEEFFAPNAEVVCVRSAQEAECRVRSLLANPDEAKAIAARAHLRIADHTWARRAVDILDICETAAPAGRFER